MVLRSRDERGQPHPVIEREAIERSRIGVRRGDAVFDDRGGGSIGAPGDDRAVVRVQGGQADREVLRFQERSEPTLEGRAGPFGSHFVSLPP